MSEISKKITKRDIFALKNANVCNLFVVYL